MISPRMFGEFMVPVLNEMTERVSYSMYHWDGPGALPHHDHLLSLKRLTAIQWTPGAGDMPAEHKKWWPIYHKTIGAGKRVLIFVDPSLEPLMAMKREFGPGIKSFLFGISASSTRQAQEIIRSLSD